MAASKRDRAVRVAVAAAEQRGLRVGPAEPESARECTADAGSSRRPFRRPNSGADPADHLALEPLEPTDPYGAIVYSYCVRLSPATPDRHSVCSRLHCPHGFRIITRASASFAESVTQTARLHVASAIVQSCHRGLQLYLDPGHLQAYLRDVDDQS